MGAINLPIIVADEKKPIISPRLDSYMSAVKAKATGVKAAVAIHDTLGLGRAAKR